MDKDISRWIMEFVMRHSTSDQLLKRVALKLPVSNQDFLLKKAILLRTLQSEISNTAVPETVLDLLERLANLDEKEGLKIARSLKVAFCTVAVEYTIKFLEAEEGYDKFYVAAENIWKGKVASLVAARKDLVATEEVEKWSNNIQSALSDINMRRDLGKMYSQCEALQVVRVYLKEAWAQLRPPFLDSAVAQLRLSEEKELEDQGGGYGGDREEEKELEDKGGGCGVDRETAAATEYKKGIVKENMPTRCKHIARHRRPRESIRVADDEESDLNVSYSKKATLLTPEVNRVQEALKSSSIELHELVKDPLPDALVQGKALVSEISRRNLNQNHSMETLNGVTNHEASVGGQNSDENELNPFSNIIAKPIQANETNCRNPRTNHEDSVEDQRHVEHVLNPLSNNNVGCDQANKRSSGNPSCVNQKAAHKPSLMERNSTAHTYEWDDSIDESAGGPSDHANRFHLSSPERIVVSPLRKYEAGKVGRRQVKRWSSMEEAALRKGVEEFGRGNWKLILGSNPEAFSGRTEVDLKDKWRNMTR